MKTAVITAAVFALSLAIPALIPAQSYSEDITIPLPNFGGNNNNRAQQAEVPDRGSRYCADLRRRADDLRYRVDNAQYRDDARRAEDQLRDVDDQLWRDCNR